MWEKCERSSLARRYRAHLMGGQAPKSVVKTIKLVFLINCNYVGMLAVTCVC